MGVMKEDDFQVIHLMDIELREGRQKRGSRRRFKREVDKTQADGG